MHDDDIPRVVNYLKIRADGHPLADKYGKLGLHRWLVYRRLGPGPHPCHWCGKPLNWLPKQRWTGAIVVDHVDGNRGNNDEANLVVSCHPCNVRRGRRNRIDIDAGELTVMLASGPTRAVELLCEECGTAYLTRRQRATTQRFCSHACSARASGRHLAVPDDEPYVEQRLGDGRTARLRAVQRICRSCTQPFLVECGRLKKGTGNFCSYQCAGKTNGQHTANRRRGAEHPHTSLTEADVREMRRLWAAGGVTLSALGARFGVTKSNANMVVYRRSWKHIE